MLSKWQSVNNHRLLHSANPYNSTAWGLISEYVCRQHLAKRRGSPKETTTEMNGGWHQERESKVHNILPLHSQRIVYAQHRIHHQQTLYIWTRVQTVQIDACVPRCMFPNTMATTELTRTRNRGSESTTGNEKSNCGTMPRFGNNSSWCKQWNKSAIRLTPQNPSKQGVASRNDEINNPQPATIWK